MHNFIFDNIPTDKQPYPYNLSIYNGVVRKVNNTTPSNDGNVNVVTTTIEDNEGGGVVISSGETSRTVAKYTEIEEIRDDLETGYTTERNISVGFALDNNGNETAYSGYKTTFYCSKNFLPVSPNTQYRTVNETSSSDNVSICEYDSGKNFIKKTLGLDDWGSHNKTITTTSETAFVKIGTSSQFDTAPTYSSSVKIKREDEWITVWSSDYGVYHKGLSDKQNTLTATEPLKIVGDVISINQTES